MTTNRILLICAAGFAAGIIFNGFLKILKEIKILRLKKSFIFPIDVLEGVIIASASGDADAIKEWIEDCSAMLDRSKNYSPKKSEAWYILAKEALHNKASDRFDIALKLIKQKHYSHAVEVLVISNKEIMEYKVIE